MLQRQLTALLITVAAAAMCGRILAAVRVYEPHLFRDAAATGDTRSPWPAERPDPTPAFGSNDRSRWATIRALVEDGTYVIGRRDPARATRENPHGDTGIPFEAGGDWHTVDKVLRPDTQEFYSSKPPLLPTLLAGEYWLLKRLFGWSLADPEQIFWVVRTVLLTVNALPLTLYLVLLARLVERYGTTDWGRLYVTAAACFGTFLTTFAITLNNHTVAACTALYTLYASLCILDPAPAAPAGDSRPDDNPADPSPRHFLLAGFLAAFTACVELPAASFAALVTALLLWRAPRPTLLFFVPAAAVPVAAFFLTNYLAIGQLLPAYGEFGGPWYEYPGSHWESPRGIDAAREGKATYAFHFLLGHHGLLTLTPIWLLALAGMARVFRPSREPAAFARDRLLPGVTLLLTVVVTGFYLVRTNNYGGGTSGPRWLFWLTPLFLLVTVPAADRLATRRWGRGLALGLLAVSVLSASYPAWNPWRHPWLYNALSTLGWPGLPY